MSLALTGPVPIGGYFPDIRDAQEPAAVGVCIGTLLRPCLVEAIRSVYRQAFPGRIQILVGVDKPTGPDEPLLQVLAERPEHVSAVVLQLPYSTSVRHGGVHPANDGGAIRALLSFLANSRHVAYLDDDNLWEADHLSDLMTAVQGKAWAHSMRLLVEEGSGRELGIDRWDSVGVDRGRFAAEGGFVDTNCLLVDKVVVARALGRWSESDKPGTSLQADRNFFNAIKHLPHGQTGRATVRYGIRPTNVLNKFIADGTEF